jgi:hypothetical protein
MIDFPFGCLIENTLDAPLSMRACEARTRLGLLFSGGELRGLADETRRELRGLEMFLLAVSTEAFDLECAAMVSRVERPRRRRWLWWGRRR